MPVRVGKDRKELCVYRAGVLPQGDHPPPQAGAIPPGPRFGQRSQLLLNWTGLFPVHGPSDEYAVLVTSLTEEILTRRSAVIEIGRTWRTISTNSRTNGAGAVL